MLPDETPVQRLRFRATAIATMVIAAISLAWCIYSSGWKGLGAVAGMVGTGQVIGKNLIFAGVSPKNTFGFGPWAIAYTLVVFDVLVALLLNAFLPAIERFRWIGPKLIRVRERSTEAFLQYPRLNRMAFTGVALWVFLPLPASGAVTGSFVSALVGLSRIGSVGAIFVGSVVNSILYAALANVADRESEMLLNNWRVTLAASIVLAIFMWIGWRRFHQVLRRD